MATKDAGAAIAKTQARKNWTFADFAGLNTQALRTAIKPNEFSALENALKIGHGNFRTVPGPSTVVAEVSAGQTIYYLQSVTIGTTVYMMAASVAGQLFAVNLSTMAVTTVQASTNFTACQMCQWKNERVLIVDQVTGYWDWDGTTLTHNTGSSAPATGTAIGAFSGIVWISGTGTAGRTISYSRIDSGAGSTNFRDFTAPGGSFIITDSNWHSNIVQLYTANNYLYALGQDAVNVIADVRVVGGVYVFSNTNISSGIGTEFASSVIAYYRSLWFASQVGFFGVYGATVRKGSDQLDGIFQDLVANTPFTSAQATIYNLLCLSFLFNWTSPTGNRSVIALFLNGEWMLMSQGNELTFMTGAVVDGINNAYATDGTGIYQLFADEGNQVAWQIQTALNPMGNPLVTKQVTKFGMGIFYTSSTESINVSIDTELSSEVYSVSGAQAGFTWVNQLSALFTWVNVSTDPFTWYSAAGYFFLTKDVDNSGKYCGLTVSATTSPVVVTLLALEFLERNIWSRQ